ncbi:SDR family oxidoreductase [Candidatus Dojkabacteria bacterium]|nr:SDR family oxidoreductase [Candidatus Dojkabacteria bacterium]
MELKAKVVLITGASSGIGQHLAKRFANEGCRLILTYNSNLQGMKDTMKSLKNAEVIYVKCDLKSESEITNLFKTVINKFGILDIVVNNAGVGSDAKPFLQQSQKDMLELLGVNLVGMMSVCQKSYQIFSKKHIKGKIINTSSIRGGEYGGGSAVVYSASKAAVNSLTKTLAKLWGPKILVNAVAPGFTYVPRYEKFSEEMKSGFIAQTVTGRYVSLDEVADTFIFLAKNDSMTGQVVYVDGGFTLK